MAQRTCHHRAPGQESEEEGGGALLDVSLDFLAAAAPAEGQWLLAGLIQVGLGLALGDLYVRRFGLVLFSLVVLKAFLVDFPSLGGVVRIVSFLALGGVLLAVSYCYYKYHDKIVKHL
jgi:uncharacterized membrane protein